MRRILAVLAFCSLAVAQPVVINEIESSGGSPGDWVELYNAGVSPVDIGGYVFKDSNDSNSYTIPAGTTIPAGGYYVLNEVIQGVGQFNFGLGTPDSARLFDSLGVLVDSYSWGPHATTTYGRCPNGTGAFTTTNSPTKGAANDCGGGSPVTTLKINEVESNGGTPDDWVELINTGTSPIDISGWRFLDNDDTHTPYVIPSGTTIAPGGYYVLESGDFGFGLGAPDSVRLYDADGNLYESYSWAVHATTTYGRCPNGSGDFATTASSTKGTANDCAIATSAVKINEVESNEGSPGDWVELFNPGTAAEVIGGFVFKDNNDSNSYTIPAGTTIPAGGYYVLEESLIGFGLGSADSARLFDAASALVDSYTWTEHASTTYGRCPNGEGEFTTTTAPTKGTANSCPAEFTFLPWPGGQTVQTVDTFNAFPSNLSSLTYEGLSAAQGVLWAARNAPSALFRLIFDGTNWVPDTANDWGSGKQLRYPDGTGDPDAEGVTLVGTNSINGLYVATERNNNANAVSRNSILRFDIGASGATLTATNEWNLTADLPVTGPNLGLEAITWIPDSFLVLKGFIDESKNAPYNPADYPNHGDGVFFVALEANGIVYGYVLDQSGSGFTRIVTITTGFTGVMDLRWDRDLYELWAVCDDTCQGRSAVLRIQNGKFTVAFRFERPTGMPNINNEGFAIAPVAQCVNGLKPVFWSDDSNTDGHAIREGTLSCLPYSSEPVDTSVRVRR